MKEDPALTAQADAHFVDHVVASAHDLKASEDILAATGAKLLAKGARVDAATRERLVAHKLAKPLEQCLQMADAVDPAALVAVARRLFDEQPVLRSLHGDRQAHTLAALAALPLTGQLRSLLSLYAELPWTQLDHAVAVALLAQGLSGRLGPGDATQDRTLWTAGLFHDVGELYVDPQVFTGGPLDATQWRHIVAHPVVGHRVLRDLDGAGRSVADAVLQHHERHDGFGYPRRLAGDDLPARGELLAAAEWLGGLMRAGRSPLSAAAAATKLMPGSFRDAIARTIRTASGGEAADAEPAASAPADVLDLLVRIAGTIGRFRASRGWIEGLIGAGTGASAVLAANHERMEAIERSFVRSGLSGEEPHALFARLAAFGDAQLIDELGAIVREIGWHLRELERDTLLRAGSLAADQQRTVREMIARVKQPAVD